MACVSFGYLSCQRAIALWPVPISYPTEDRKLSWPRWAGYIPCDSAFRAFATSPDNSREANAR